MKKLRTDPEDRRCKRIYVLPKGWQCHELMHQTIQNNEQRMTEGFTEEERELFFDLLQRAIRNMGGDPTPRRFKEDNNA
jgi:DNA-binding MarR family transcriptional regulator